MPGLNRADAGDTVEPEVSGGGMPSKGCTKYVSTGAGGVPTHQGKPWASPEAI